MSKVFVLFMVLGSVAFAKVGVGTYDCFGAALRVAANKMAKDSQNKSSVLYRIGFKSNYCDFDAKNERIVCYNARDIEQFDAYLENSKINKDFGRFTEMSFIFKTGTQGLDVYYNLIFARGKNANSCTYIKTYVRTESTEESYSPNTKSQEEVQQCVRECIAAFDTPSAELKACVASCTK